jgi:alcohol dehydrogenase (cytochrome c)
MAWYYQATPHDTHDWDSAQTPVMIDGVIDGKPRKLLAQANRNGHFFLLDRTNGKHILTAPFIDSINWTKEINKNGQPVGNPEKEASIPGALVSPTTDGATNWPPPSFNPDTGLFYVGTTRGVSMFYLTDTDPRPQGWAAAERHVGNFGTELKAIDYKTGKIVWSRPLATSIWGPGGGSMGLLSTAGQAPLRQRRGRQLRGLRRGHGKPLWHAGLATTRRTGRRPSCSTAANTWSSAPATSSSRSRCSSRSVTPRDRRRRGYRAGLSRPGSKR